MLRPSGVVVDSTPVFGRSLLTGAQLARAARAMIMVDRPPPPAPTTPSGCSPRPSRRRKPGCQWSSSARRWRSGRTRSRACAGSSSSVGPSRAGALVARSLRPRRGGAPAAGVDAGRRRRPSRAGGCRSRPPATRSPASSSTRWSPSREAPRPAWAPEAGLGLAIVDVIARAHGGAAHAANRDGGADAWLAPGPPRAHTACCGDNSPLSRPEGVKGCQPRLPMVIL